MFLKVFFILKSMLFTTMVVNTTLFKNKNNNIVIHSYIHSSIHSSFILYCCAKEGEPKC